jgi:hypothetical protein
VLNGRLLLLGAATSAFAGALLTAAPAIGQALFPTQPASACAISTLNAFHGTFGRIQNLTNPEDDVIVSCPIIRIIQTADSGLVDAHAYVYRETWDSGDDPISCSWISWQNDATDLLVDIVSANTGTASGDMVLHAGSALDLATETTGNSAGFYNMVCVLPKNDDAIYGYGWEE